MFANIRGMIIPQLHQSHRIHVWYIYLHAWLIFMVNVGRYIIHGSYGIYTYITLNVCTWIISLISDKKSESAHPPRDFGSFLMAHFSIACAQHLRRLTWFPAFRSGRASFRWFKGSSLDSRPSQKSSPEPPAKKETWKGGTWMSSWKLGSIVSNWFI